MTTKKYPTGIKTPKREEKNGGAFLLNLDTVEAWINGLPRGSAGRTAQELFSGLQDINKIKLDCEDRVDYLELVREPLFYTMSIMEKHFVGENFPLTKKQKKIAELSKEFCLLMMTGYVIAIEELLEDYHEKHDKNLLGQLIYLAISFLNRYLLISYQVYMMVPDEIWGNYHKLYVFAEENKVENIKIPDNKFQYVKETSIAEEYMRGLLLATASPYHMCSNEVENVYINIERWLESVKIFKEVDNLKSRHVVVIDVTSSKPVIHGNDLKGRRKKNLRVISIDKLIHKIEHELHNGEILASQTLIAANLENAVLSHDILKRLQHFWLSEPESVISNGKSRKIVKMTVGVSATYDLAKQASRTGNLDDLFKGLSDFDDFEVVDAPPKVTAGKNGKEQKLPQTNYKSLEEEWMLINEKKGEFSLQSTGSCKQQLQVGEVVGIQYLEKDRKGVVILGIISWLQVCGDNLIKTGIKLVSASAIPVEIRPVSDNVAQDQSQRAFLLPLLKELGQVSSVFGLPASLRSGAAVIIGIYGKEIPVRLTTKLISSGLYSQYQFEAVAKRVKQQAPQSRISARNRAPGTGFEDIWDSI